MTELQERYARMRNADWFKQAYTGRAIEEGEPMSLNHLVRRAWTTAEKSGFHAPPNTVSFDNPPSVLSKLMLITTEVAEAAEAVRHRDEDNFAEELADVCIRVFDLAHSCGINLDEAIAEKMQANDERLFMHGDKAA